MHKVELLEQAFEAIKRLGYQIREECVGGEGGGSCVLRGKKWFFVDPLLGIDDQLELACDALRGDPELRNDELPPDLCRYIFPTLPPAAAIFSPADFEHR